MECIVCGMSTEEFLSVEDDGKKRLVLCPNHQLMVHLDMVDDIEVKPLPSEVKPEGECSVCNKPKIYFKDGKTVFDVCADHADKLTRRCLSPAEFKVLYAKHPDAYLLHDDFYHPYTGEAFQPVNK